MLNIRSFEKNQLFNNPDTNNSHPIKFEHHVRSTFPIPKIGSSCRYIAINRVTILEYCPELCVHLFFELLIKKKLKICLYCRINRWVGSTVFQRKWEVPNALRW